MTEQNEFDFYITPDGLEYSLSDFMAEAPIARWVEVTDGHGAVDLDLVEQQGTYQDGATLLDYRLPPRDIVLQHGRGACTRQAYWDMRAQLLDYLRPNRGTGRGMDACGALRKILPNGAKRDIKALVISGPKFAALTDGWRRTTFIEQIRFHCPDPVFYDPTAVAVDLDGSYCSDLIFPFDFPFVFCVRGTVATDTITYAGTWAEYPVIYATGPFDLLAIRNLTTNEKLELNYSVPAGVTVTIDLRYSYKTVTDSAGNDLIGSLSTDSDLATWHLEPDPRAPGGANQISASMVGGSAGSGTAVRLVYYTRYYGI